MRESCRNPSSPRQLRIRASGDQSENSENHPVRSIQKLVKRTVFAALSDHRQHQAVANALVEALGRKTVIELSCFEMTCWIHGGYTDLGGSCGGVIQNIREPRYSAVLGGGR